MKLTVAFLIGNLHQHLSNFNLPEKIQTKLKDNIIARLESCPDCILEHMVTVINSGKYEGLSNYPAQAGHMPQNGFAPGNNGMDMPYRMNPLPANEQVCHGLPVQPTRAHLKPLTEIESRMLAEKANKLFLEGFNEDTFKALILEVSDISALKDELPSVIYVHDRMWTRSPQSGDSLYKSCNDGSTLNYDEMCSSHSIAFWPKPESSSTDKEGFYAFSFFNPPAAETLSVNHQCMRNIMPYELRLAGLLAVVNSCLSEIEV